jgi:hypothetical protein
MILNKTFKQLIKIKDLAYLNDLGCEVIEYYPNKQYLNGRVYVTGAYHSSKNNEVKLISIILIPNTCPILDLIALNVYG